MLTFKMRNDDRARELKLEGAHPVFQIFSGKNFHTSEPDTEPETWISAINSDGRLIWLRAERVELRQIEIDIAAPGPGLVSPARR